VFVFGNILIGFARVLDMVLTIYMWLLIGRAIVSWVNADPRNAIVRFLIMVTDPPLWVIRRMLPSSLRYFPLDIAFLVLFGLVIFAQFALVQTLVDVGQRLRVPTAYAPLPAGDVPNPTLPAATVPTAAPATTAPSAARNP